MVTIKTLKIRRKEKNNKNVCKRNLSNNYRNISLDYCVCELILSESCMRQIPFEKI